MIISDDPGLAIELEELLGEVSGSIYLKRMSFLHDGQDLELALKELVTSIVFLDLSDARQAEATCEVIRRINPGTQVIGFMREATQESLLMAVRYALRDVMVAPLSV